MAAAFVESHRKSPITDGRNKTHIHIERQTRGYKRNDPSTKHEKALPPIVFRHRLQTAKLPRELARAHLLCLALFFAMRSCEYVYVGTRDRKTRPIRAKDIVFRTGSRTIPHSSDEIFLADSVSIEFGDQKSEIKDETVSQDASDDLGGLCPVEHAAFTIRRLQSYPDYSEDWEVFTFHEEETGFSKITSSELLLDIRAAVDCIGRDVLGFGSEDVGTHSVRSSLAMMAYLDGVPVYTIMLLGRWSSDAFLSYIEKQVKEFTRGISARMIKSDVFYNIPRARESTDPSSNKPRHGLSHHRRKLLGLNGRQGSLRRQLMPRD